MDTRKTDTLWLDFWYGLFAKSLCFALAFVFFSTFSFAAEITADLRDPIYLEGTLMTERGGVIRAEGIRLNWWQRRSNKSNYAGLELTGLGRTVLTHYAGLARKAITLRRSKQASKPASLGYRREYE